MRGEGPPRPTPSEEEGGEGNKGRLSEKQIEKLKLVIHTHGIQPVPLGRKGLGRGIRGKAYWQEGEGMRRSGKG